MELLSALGVNSTIWIHLGLFLIAFVFLSQLVFKPYAAALEAREKRTGGADHETSQIMSEIAQINADYEMKARALNTSIRTEFEKLREEANKIAQEKMSAARDEAAELVRQSRAKIESELSSARAQISKEIPQLKNEIVARLAGKEISA